jgi:hypothetical protein
MIRFISCFFAIFLFACKPSQSEVCEDEFKANPQFVLDEMVGTWKNQDGIHFERWRKVDRSHYLSDVYSVEGKDTVLQEVAKVYFVDRKWNFENWVKVQNENQNVIFSAATWDDRKIAFKNPTHDFPTEIHYEVVSDSMMTAFILGKNDLGKSDTIHFKYRRLN